MMVEQGANGSPEGEAEGKQRGLPLEGIPDA